MRQINDVVRTKKVFNLSQEEFITGGWLKTIPSCDKLEIEYKSNFLVVKTASFTSEKEEEENGTGRTKK